MQTNFCEKNGILFYKDELVICTFCGSDLNRDFSDYGFACDCRSTRYEKNELFEINHTDLKKTIYLSYHEHNNTTKCLEIKNITTTNFLKIEASFNIDNFCPVNKPFKSILSTLKAQQLLK